MLTEYIGVNIFLSHLEMLGEAETKSCCVQKSSGTDDLVFRKSRDLGEYISHDIHRIAYNNIKGIRRFFYNLGGNALSGC